MRLRAYTHAWQKSDKVYPARDYAGPNWPAVAEDAYAYGVMVSERAYRLGRKHRHGWKGSPAQAAHQNGCSAAAEALVARLTGLPWSSRIRDCADGKYEGDVGDDLAVRWTPRLDGRLIVHPDDWDGLKAVLVVGDYPWMTVIGWLPMTECKQPRFWREGPPYRNPAYFVAGPFRDLDELMMVPA